MRLSLSGRRLTDPASAGQVVRGDSAKWRRPLATSSPGLHIWSKPGMRGDARKPLSILVVADVALGLLDQLPQLLVLLELRLVRPRAVWRRFR